MIWFFSRFQNHCTKEQMSTFKRIAVQIDGEPPESRSCQKRRNGWEPAKRTGRQAGSSHLYLRPPQVIAAFISCTTDSTRTGKQGMGKVCDQRDSPRCLLNSERSSALPGAAAHLQGAWPCSHGDPRGHVPQPMGPLELAGAPVSAHRSHFPSCSHANPHPKSCG